MYTIEDLEAALAQLRRWNEAYADDTSNNPEKYRREINDAARKVREIERALKDSGVIPLTEHEKVERELDSAFPNAQSKQIVEYKGKRYQRRYFPLQESRSGKTVQEWGKEWVEVAG